MKDRIKDTAYLRNFFGLAKQICPDGDNKPHVIVVPGGMMADIVKPLWDERVQITGTQISTGQRNKNKIELLDIEKVVEGEDG